MHEIAKSVGILYIIEEYPQIPQSDIEKKFADIFGQEIDSWEIKQMIERLRNRDLISISYGVYNGRPATKLYRARKVPYVSAELGSLVPVARSKKDVRDLFEGWANKNRDILE